MEDPDYVPDWTNEEEESKRRRKRARHRSKTPEPEFDYKSHYLKLKEESQNAYMTGIARPPLRIASFNIQIFGEKKMKSKDVTAILIKILQRYDLILIQEIRDSSDTALDKLVNLLTQVDPHDPYASIVSERLGRTNSKEQYAFMFRTSRIAVADTYQYDDGEDNGKDLFQREPFAVRFYSPYSVVNDFGIIAIHTEPESAVKEIDALVKVYDSTKKKWGLANIMIAGDFNADEGYIHRDDWAKIALRNDRRFKWMIDDDTDTTVGNTDRAYDRFVVAGKELKNAVVKGSNQVYKFDEALGLSSEEAEEVSDHYPIEIEFAGCTNYALQNQLTTDISVTIKQKTPIKSVDLVSNICNASNNPESSAYFNHTTYYDNTDPDAPSMIISIRRNVKDVIQALQDFQLVFPGIVLDESVIMATSYMESTFMTERPMIYGLWSNQHPDGSGDFRGHCCCFDIEIKTKAKEPLDCCITISRPMS